MNPAELSVVNANWSTRDRRYYRNRGAAEARKRELYNCKKKEKKKKREAGNERERGAK